MAQTANKKLPDIGEYTNQPVEQGDLTMENGDRDLVAENAELKEQVKTLTKQINQYKVALESMQTQYQNVIEAYNLLFEGYIKKGTQQSR